VIGYFEDRAGGSARDRAAARLDPQNTQDMDKIAEHGDAAIALSHSAYDKKLEAFAIYGLFWSRAINAFPLLCPTQQAHAASLIEDLPKPTRLPVPKLPPPDSGVGEPVDLHRWRRKEVNRCISDFDELFDLPMHAILKAIREAGGVPPRLATIDTLADQPADSSVSNGGD
jgi:hypothetical protein